MIWSRVISINETTTSRCVKPFSLKKPDRDAAADRTLRRAACCTAPAQNVRPCSFLGSHALEINHLDRLFLRRKVASYSHWCVTTRLAAPSGEEELMVCMTERSVPRLDRRFVVSSEFGRSSGARSSDHLPASANRSSWSGEVRSAVTHRPDQAASHQGLSAVRAHRGTEGSNPFPPSPLGPHD